MQVHCGEGVANRTGPEPCVFGREAGDEASAGECIGQPLSREIINRDADAFVTAEGNTGVRVNASALAGPARSQTLACAARSLSGNREISCPSGAFAPPDRVGKATSRSR